jgi:type II secretory pathway pseudopilin PulG
MLEDAYVAGQRHKEQIKQDIQAGRTRAQAEMQRQAQESQYQQQAATQYQAPVQYPPQGQPQYPPPPPGPGQHVGGQPQSFGTPPPAGGASTPDYGDQ